MKLEKLLEIREIARNWGLKNYPNTFHVSNNLCWYRYQKAIEYLSRTLPRNAKVLDVGCGWGHTTAGLANMRPDLTIIGLEIEKVQLWKIFGDYGYDFIFVVGNALVIPFKQNSFDAVISFGVMEHLRGEDKKFLAECHRVLKKGGSNILFNLPNKYGLNEFFARRLGASGHDRKYTRQQIVKLFINNGFKNLYINRHYVIPSLVEMVTKNILIALLFNRYYLIIDRLDRYLSKTPLGFISGEFTIMCKK